MCGNDAPKAEAVDAVAPLKEGFTRKSFSVPLKSYGSDSTATLAFLDIIDVHDRQLFISEYASAPCLIKAMGCDTEMKAAASWSDAEAWRKQVDQTAGFFVDYPYSDIPNTIAVHHHMDPHMLNRAEWVKFVGAFFNLEDAATKHMQEEESKWEELSTSAAAKSATPLVAFIDSWGGYTISLAAYKTLLVEAAGGRSFTEADFAANAHAVVGGGKITFNSSDPDGAAAFRAALADADVLIDETYAWDPPSYTASSFEGTYGFDGAGAKVFRLDGLLGGLAGNGLDWFEGSFARPATVLADFVAAMHATGEATTYLRTLDGTPTVMTAEDCDYKIPVCDDVDAAIIESPCDRYGGCVDEEGEKVKDAVEDAQESACVAATLLIA